MDVQQALDIMQSDMKLWDTAETEDLGEGRVTKTLDLPWGIGKLSVTLEGMTDATKRRDAVAQYGAFVRAEIEERIDDEAITSRAKAAAARAELDNSADGDSLATGGTIETGEARPLQEAGKAPSELTPYGADLGATLIARAAEIEGRLRALEEERDNLARDRDGIEAALLAMGYTK